MTGRPVAVVTGASRGIGRAIARKLTETHDIVAVARSEGELRSLAEEIQRRGGACAVAPADVTDPEAVERALGAVEAAVLVNNAGVGVIKPLLELSTEEWRRVVDVNFNALFYVTRTLLPGMIRRGGGDVVNIGSLAGRNSFVGGTAYAGTKHAVMAFTESLMLEVRDAGVKVSVVSPGSVRTNFSPEFAGKDWALAPEDVADAVLHVLDTPPGVLVHRLEVRTLTVPKKR